MSEGARPFPRVVRRAGLAGGRGLVQAVVSLAGLPLFLASVLSVLTLLSGVGVLFLPRSLLAVRRLASRQRRCALQWSEVRIATPYRPRPAGAADGLAGRLECCRAPDRA